ncbi:hypothetical protein P4416_32580 [Bacillus thuringiensis]|nr:hypothetical protein [Bacillus thuringiensis]
MKLLRKDNEFFVLTLLLILIASSINYKNIGLTDYVGIASTIVLIAAIGIKLLGVASGKCGFTTLRKPKYKKSNFSVL